MESVFARVHAVPLTSTLLALALLLMGCPTEGDDDDATPEPGVIISSINPEPDSVGFVFNANIQVTFSAEVESVTIDLAGVTGTQTVDGLTATFDPDTDLSPNTAYDVTVTWSPSDVGSLSYSFTTGPHGDAVADPESLVGVVYALDLAAATFLKPAGIGGIIGSQLEGLAILFETTADSDFAGNEVHVIGALGDDDGVTITQDPCAQTLPWTAGEDGIVGTTDDTPASFDNPQMTVGPADLTLAIQGVSTRLQDVFLTGTVHPDLVDIQGLIFEGNLDTRALDGLIGTEGEVGSACTFLEDTVGVACQECGGEFPGPYCLDVLAVDMVAMEVPGLAIASTSCADVITRALEGSCEAEDAEAFDSNGDGTYDLCPEF